MKSVICSSVLIVSLGVGSSLFAQGRGRAGGSPPSQSRPDPAAGAAATGRPSDVGTTNRPTPAAARRTNGKASARVAQTPNSPSKQISDNPALASKLQGLLPQGTNLDAAASGFKNTGQFVAAVHVSNNLNIPFDQLKAKMLADHVSLGEAVHALKPEMNKDAAKAEAKKAEGQAKKDTNGKS